MVHLDLVEHPMKKLGLDLVDNLDLVDYLDLIDHLDLVDHLDLDEKLYHGRIM